MRLKQTTVLAILAMLYFFILRTIGTFYPDLFSFKEVIQTTSVLSILFCLALLSFFIAFKNFNIKNTQKTLKVSTNWTIAGYTAMSFVYAGEFLNIFQINFLPDLLNSRVVEAAKPVIPWLGSVFVFVFFLNFYQVNRRDKQNELFYPKLFAVIGGGLSLLLRTMILLAYFSGKTGKWYFDLSGIPLVIGFFLAAISFLFLEYFFLSFFKNKAIIRHPSC
ncbi:hypothetical protein ACFLRW_00380 [Acidobacteriota bacterium]